MRTLIYNFHIPLSQRPNWLLMFTGLAKGYFNGEWKEEEQKMVLDGLSNFLDKQTFTQRTLVRSCSMIPREIIADRSLVIYSSTRGRPLLTISFS